MAAEHHAVKVGDDNPLFAQSVAHTIEALEGTGNKKNRTERNTLKLQLECCHAVFELWQRERKKERAATVSDDDDTDYGDRVIALASGLNGTLFSAHFDGSIRAWR
jgi:hypothetical protein